MSKQIILTPTGGDLYMAQIYIDGKWTGQPIMGTLTNHLLTTGNYDELGSDKIKNITINIDQED